MAETLQEEQAAESQTAPEETPQEAPEELPQEEQQPEEDKKKPKERNILLPVLTVLLILVGISELVFWGYFGFSVYASSLARERYEQEQKALAETRTGGSSYSPNLKVENGTVTWERENWGYTGSAQPSNTSTTPRREDGLRLSRLPVVKIPYTLAEMDEELPSPEREAGEAAPTST